MLDESLPTFYLKPNTEHKHLWTIYLCQHGNEPEPAYSLRYPDPSSPSSKNRYAAALCDPYVPDVIYGEVLIIPEWTQPNLSAEAIRLNGGVIPPPEPILPSQFTIHLYNPDQQITVRYKTKTWNTSMTWEFEMPQQSFRQPSSSTLDRTQSDPAVADTTPKLKFSWRRDSKLSKDLTCLLSGKTSTIPETKTKSKEPDITLSIFKSLRELTLYEPNLYRVEMEDFKGLEVVLLLGAVTIRDVWFTSMKEAFRIVRDAPEKKPVPSASGTSHANNESAASNNSLGTRPPPPPTGESSSSQQREQERLTKKLLEEEEKAKEKARRKREAEIEEETQRLRRLYGQEEQMVRASSPQLPRRPAPPPQPPRPQQPHDSRFYHRHTPSVPHLPPGPRPYLHNGRPHSSVYLVQPVQPEMSGAKPANAPKPQSPPQQLLQPKKSSFFGLRKSSDDSSKLSKKRSSMF